VSIHVSDLMLTPLEARQYAGAFGQ
jgi:hypothetical protein